MTQKQKLVIKSGGALTVDTIMIHRLADLRRTQEFFHNDLESLENSHTKQQVFSLTFNTII